MAERYQKKTVLNFKQAPDYQSRAHAQVQQSWQQVGQVANQVSKVAFKFLENEVAADAKVAGMLAGQKKEGGLQTGWSKHTTYGQNYNTGFVAAYGAEIALEANEKITEYSMQAQNSQEFKSLAEGYRKGLLGGVSDPLLQGLANSKIDQYFGPAYKAMIKKEYQVELDKALYLQKAGLEQLASDATHLFDVAGNEADGLNAAYNAENQFLSVLNAAVNSPDRNSRISVEVADEISKDYFSQTAMAVQGGANFEAAMNDGVGHEWIDIVRNRNPKDLRLTQEQHDKLITRMEKKLKNHLDYQEDLADADEDATKAYQEQNHIDFLLGKELTHDALDAALEAHDITDTDYKSLSKMLEEGESDSNKIALAELYVDLSTKGPNGIMESAVQMVSNGEINATDFKAVFNAVQSGMGSAPTQRKEFSQAQSLLKMHFAKTGMMGNLLGNSGQEMAQHNIELYNRVKEGENPYEVAKEMVEADVARSALLSRSVYWRGSLEESVAALRESFISSGKYPDGSDRTEFNSLYEELEQYSKQVATQQAIEAHSGK
jgi:hypothetical protein